MGRFFNERSFGWVQKCSVYRIFTPGTREQVYTIFFLRGWLCRREVTHTD